MPLGGMLVAIFAGWFFKPQLAMEELSVANDNIFKTWRFFKKFISPVLEVRCVVGGHAATHPRRVQSEF